MLRTVLVEEKRRKIVKATFGSIVRAGFNQRIIPAVKPGCQPCYFHSICVFSRLARASLQFGSVYI